MEYSRIGKNLLFYKAVAIISLVWNLYLIVSFNIKEPPGVTFLGYAGCGNVSNIILAILYYIFLNIFILPAGIFWFLCMLVAVFSSFREKS